MDFKTKPKIQLKLIVESLNLTLEKDLNDYSKSELISILEENSKDLETSQSIIEVINNNEISPLEKRKWNDYIKRCGLTPKEFLILYPTHPAIQIIKTL